MQNELRSSDGIVLMLLATEVASMEAISPTLGIGAVAGGGAGGGPSPNSPAFRSTSATTGEVTTASVIVSTAIAILPSRESSLTKPHIGSRWVQGIDPTCQLPALCAMARSRIPPRRERAST
jgi:hypothetical protein